MQLVLDLKVDGVSELAQVGRVPSPNHKIEIVTPLPLAELDTILKNMAEYDKTRKMIDVHEFEELGKGNFGKVYGYKDYAIKYVSGGTDSYRGYGDGSTDELLDAYVMRELQCVPSVPRLYAVVNDTYIIMEKIDGMTMKQYKEQMEDIQKMDNFINPNFVKAHKEAMKDILMAEFIPADLHSDNVMICRKTGLPKIVDVGLFKKMDKYDLEKRGEKREDVLIKDFYGAKNAVDFAQRLQRFCNEKKFPQLKEDRIEELMEEQEENRRYKEKKIKKQEEREKRQRERDEEQKRKEKNRVHKKEEQRFGILGGWGNIHVNDWANLAPVRPFFIEDAMFEPKLPHWNPIDRIHKTEKKLTKAQQIIAQKKENQFKKGLQNKFKGDRNKQQFNIHKNRFAG